MTETYEEFISKHIEFISKHIENLNDCLIELYDDYEENGMAYFVTFTDMDEDKFVLFKNSEEWFKDIFCVYILHYNQLTINNYELLCTDTDDDIYDEDAKMNINTQFINNYINNILTFEHLKNVLYKNEIYNEVFADEVDLK